MPTWKWLAGVLTLFGYLGTTRRPLKAWLCRNHSTLFAQNFANRVPVKEREKYCNLGNEDNIAHFTTGTPARFWIHGVGGSGKSSLAYRMLRVAITGKATGPLPILIDEDWGDSLTEYVVRVLKVGDRAPTSKMVETLGAIGLLCPLVDSLSERGMEGAVEQSRDGIRRGPLQIHHRDFATSLSDRQGLGRI